LLRRVDRVLGIVEVARFFGFDLVAEHAVQK